MEQALLNLFPTLAPAPNLAYLRTSKGRPSYYIENNECLGLHLANCELTETTWSQVLAIIQGGTHLRVLHLARSRFVHVELNLPRLEYLELSYTETLQHLQLGAMPHLQKLVLNDCALQTLQLPEALPQLTSLEAARNTLRTLSLPAQLPRLRFLDVAKNQLQSLRLPASCVALEYVFALKNQLTTLEFEGALPALNILNLNDNRLTQLPLTLLESNKLEALYLYGNPLEGISEEIIGNEDNDSSSAVFSFLSAKRANTLVPLYEAKLILVGNGEVGKTSICTKLLDPNAPLPTQDQRTPGLDVYPYTIHGLPTTISGLEQPIDFRLNLWDFGGQGMYREVQQLFCRKKSAYLYVTSFDEQPNNDDYIDWHYWLQMVKAYGYDAEEQHQSPILVVKNKKDLSTTARDGQMGNTISRIAKDFPEVQILVDPISCTTCANMDVLQGAIQQLLGSLGEDVFKRNQYPSDWLEVKKALEQHPDPYLDFQTYFETIWQPKITSPKEKTDEQKAKDWLKILDRIGTVLYFPDNQVLNDWIIVKPQWVQEALFKIYRNPLLNQQEGRGPESIFEIIWPDSLEREKLIALTLQFKLAYGVTNTKGKKMYFFPALFKKQAIEIPEAIAKRITRQIRLKAEPFLPAGMLNKLTVDLHTMIHAELHYKHDVLLHEIDNETYARCEEHWENHEVVVTLYGNAVGALYHKIAETLESNLQAIRSTLLIHNLEFKEEVFYNNKWIDKTVAEKIPSASSSFGFLFGATDKSEEASPPNVSSNYNQGLFYDALVQKLKENKIILFLGTGVSAFTTQNAPNSTWRSLLQHGIDYCKEANKSECDDDWVESRNNQLKKSNPREWISAAEFITDVLREKKAFSQWLDETVGKLPIKTEALIKLLGQLNAQIYTTNYDALLKKILNLDVITNLDERKIQQVIAGNRLDTIVHLHGYYDIPDSIILGVTSYSKLVNRGFFQKVQEMIYLSKHILFIGFGAGMDDYNLGALLKWADDAPSEHPHYRLVLKKDGAVHSIDNNIRNIVYGEKHEDIIPFLEQLLKDIRHAT